MSDTPLPNDAAARSQTGEILEPNQIAPTPTPPPTDTPPTTPTEPEVKAEVKEGETVLNGKELPAPGKYEDFKLPEGLELTEAALTQATTLFKELGLNQEGAQKLIDFHVKSTQEAADAPFTLWKETQETWKNEIKNDPKLGHRIAEVKTNFARMLDGLGDAKLASEFRQAMDYTGAGNNPAFVRMMDTLSQRLTEGGHVTAGGPTNVRAPGQGPSGPSAHALFPNLK